MKSVIVIGSGFAGLSAASFLAKEGYDVTVLEKMTNSEDEPVHGKRTVLPSTWVQAGIGCRTYLRGILRN